MKESHRIQTAEYVENNELINEPEFAWWALFTLKEKEKDIAKVKS